MVAHMEGFHNLRVHNKNIFVEMFLWDPCLTRTAKLEVE